MSETTRMVRILIQVGAEESCNTKHFVERDVTYAVREDEDMTKALRHLMTEELKQVQARMESFPEARPIISVEQEEQPLLG